MPGFEIVTGELSGVYRDVLRNAHGRVIWDRGWRTNTIVADCRRLLAGFMRGDPTSAVGIQELQVGAGRAEWDQNPPLPNEMQGSLVDLAPYHVPLNSLKIDYLDGGNPSSNPTRRLQIVATLGPKVPEWPEPGNGLPIHPTATLREFGLVGQLDGAPVLINYVTHVAIVKDPFSTLERTIWLVF